MNALTRRDFETDQEVRWCPGCGDYAVLAAIQRLMPELGMAKEKIVFVSGIGCASRFPYYMDTYGFHTIHGRATAVATGLKIANPDLSVWIVAGDGDALSIGLGHLIHLIRRNVNVNILVLNNQIYGLTKGQYSPTSEFGKVTKSTPYGAHDKPLNPTALALASECSFVGRAVDVDAKGLQEVVKAAVAHQGTSFIEVLQNCNVYNDGAFAHVTDKRARPENAIYLKQGEALRYGKELDKGIKLNQCTLELIPEVTEKNESDVLVHDAYQENPTLATLLAKMEYPTHPVALGVFREIKKPIYEQLKQQADNKQAALMDILTTGQTWQVE